MSDQQEPVCPLHWDTHHEPLCPTCNQNRATLGRIGTIEPVCQEPGCVWPERGALIHHAPGERPCADPRCHPFRPPQSPQEGSSEERTMPRQYRKKPVVIEAITFDELVQHGIASGANLVNGMPWSFDYRGHQITHERDDCYLIPTLEGTMRFERGAMLITGVAGEIYPCAADIFDATYEALSS